MEGQKTKPLHVEPREEILSKLHHWSSGRDESESPVNTLHHRVAAQMGVGVGLWHNIADNCCWRLCLNQRYLKIVQTKSK